MSLPRSARGNPLFKPDPGWLFVIAGTVLVCAMLVLPAHDDLADSKHQRDRAKALADHASRRLASHAEYLSAIDREDDTLVRALAASELNLIPQSHRVLNASHLGDDRPILDRLEPRFVAPEAIKKPDSTLRSIAIDPSKRLWAMAAGMVCVLYGLLPAAGRASS